MSEVRCEHCGDSFLCRKHATEAKALETRYYCDELPPGLHQEAAKHRALSDARDELVRAAVALNAAHSDIALVAPVDPTSAVVSRRLAWSDFRAAVAAYEKLAGGA